MPIRYTDKGWYWGSKGPFPTRAKAQQVATAAYSSGYGEENQMEKSVVAEFVGTLLHSATITHFMHLQAQGEGSFAKHMALGTYYDEIVDLVDGLAEAIQGCYEEIIAPYPNMFANVTGEPLAYMRMLKEYVAQNRQNMPELSNIQNEIDSIATLIDSTIYKLRFLK
jgi:DNA-binding ferritin-like protein